MQVNRFLEKKRREIGLSQSFLKLVAIISMLVDHAAIMLIKNGKLYGYDQVLYQNAIVLPEAQSWLIVYKICRMIGRLAFPIFAFLIVEGFRKSSNLFKYFIRLTLLAIVSEIPYDLMIFNKFICFDLQNVICTYLVGLMMLFAIKMISGTSIVIHALIVAIAIIICYFLKTDYWLEGILLMFVYYEFRHDINIMCFFTMIITLLLSIEKFYGAAIFSVFFVYFYDERKGYLDLQKFSYIFYPVHMIVLYAIVYFSYLGG